MTKKSVSKKDQPGFPISLPTPSKPNKVPEGVVSPGADCTRPISGSLTRRPASVPSINSKFEAVVKDYERQFKGNVLRWRLNKGENELIILFVDGRKFHFLLPVAWIKA